MQSSYPRQTLQQQHRYGALVQTGSRGFAGGGAKKPAIDPATTDFDLILVGKYRQEVHFRPIQHCRPIETFEESERLKRERILWALMMSGYGRPAI